MKMARGGRGRAQGDKAFKSARAQGYGGSNRRAGANAPIVQVAGTAAAVYAGEPNSGNNVPTRLTGVSAKAGGGVAKPSGTGGGKRGTSGAGLYSKSAPARAKKV